GLTPAMASYLVVLCAGEFGTIKGAQDGVKLRVVTTKCKAEKGWYALESAAKILHYYNEYFGVPFPLPKLDLIALPGGFGGAMENWGGITYYESVLLFDPQSSTLGTKQDIFAVVAHEMAHQWFGDLVTMAWWDNLWLNEGFASWMGAKCTDHFNPDWNEWLRRSEPRNPTRRIGFPKDTAMQADARSSTHPVQQPVKTEAQAGSAFDEITYQKGRSIIRMLESFIGPDVFRDGIRKYVATHKYSNTTTADLWDALTEVSGKPIGEIAPAWTEQPGFPEVKLTREGTALHLEQERFTVHFADPPALSWQVPLTYGIEGVAAPSSFLLREPTATLPNEVPEDRAVKLNIGDAGYYRVAYDESSWKLLLKVSGGMSEFDRVNLLLDAWAQVEAGEQPLAHYLELAEKVTDKDQLAVYDQLIDTFTMINRLLVGDPLRPRFQQYARGLLRPAFDRVGWLAKPGQPPSLTLLRASLLRGLGTLGDSDIIASCRSRFDQFLDDPSAIAPDLRPAVFAVVGRYADNQAWEKLHALGEKTTSTEEKGRYYEALGQATAPALVERTLALSLTDELPISRAGAIPAYSARYGEHSELVWAFAKEHMKALLAKQDALGINSFAAGLFSFSTDPKDIATLQAYAKASLPKSATDSVAKTIDEIGFRAEFKQRLVPQLEAWITKTTASPSMPSPSPVESPATTPSS
ncbi:MAG: M1 family metallopeptidase, partial [Chthoniobacterales bacterium]